MRRLLILAAMLAFAPAATGAATTSPSAGAAKTPAAGAAKTPSAPSASPAKTSSASAATAPAPPQHFVYDILRNGSPIGKNVLDIDTEGGVTSVHMTSDVDVKVMFMSVYTYHYAGNETWNDDQLVAFKSQTNDNGTVHSVAVHASGDKLELEADGHRSSVPNTTGLDDFWTPDLLSKPLVLDTSNGQGMNFVAEDLGMETVTFHGAPKALRHFRLTGDIKRDLWFDADTPVRFQIKARDGSMIVSDLQ